MENKLVVNLVDVNVAHAESYDDSLEKGRISKNIHYVKNEIKFDGISIFTDSRLIDVNSYKSKHNVAWIMEPRALNPGIYNQLESLINRFDLVLTFDYKLYQKFPDKCRLIPADGIFLDTASIYKKSEKTKLCSHIFSNKTILPGHKIRHDIAYMIKENKFPIDLFGAGCGRHIVKKSDSLNEYMFSIAVENNIDDLYITEKIYDCFATRTIPIYYGSPRIKDCFDENGIITFTTVEDLKNILKTITKEVYFEKLEAVELNYSKVLKHYSVDDHVADALVKFYGIK